MADGQNDIGNRLVRLLDEQNLIIPISVVFMQEVTNLGRVDLVYELLLTNGLLGDLTVDGKNCVKSAEFRKKGTEAFVKKKGELAVELYTQSVAHAEKNSKELAFAYGNRSAVLFEWGLYKECLEDIERAIQNNYPKDVIGKLENRKSKAIELLPSQFPIGFLTTPPEIPEKDRNPLIDCATNLVKIENSNTDGRRVIACRDIEPGEIIAIEDPIFKYPLEKLFTHCHHCLKLCYNLIPCEKCTQTLYCNEKCLEDAKMYHKYECPILLTMKDYEINDLELMSMKIALVVRDKYDCLDQLATTDGSGVYRSDRYDEIHNLVGNTEKRCMADLFNRAATSATLFYLVKHFTSFFGDEQDSKYEDIFKELVLFHRQTAPCNFHEITERIGSGEPYSIGTGAYSFLSLFNHSCCPNVVRYSYGSTAILIAEELIKKGQQCYDNYGYHYALMPKLERQAKLKKQYFFNCTCEACEKDYPLYHNLPIILTLGQISLEDIRFIQDGNLEEAKRIYKEVAVKIRSVYQLKPNKNLADLQEALKACYFLFETIKTPF
ncbi:SET and MYND domain-containing protein 4 isoform X2 [Sitophilus oryzae]|uniref:Protein-lysine N-methyltransferase SMYD4 n=1 Tax=Sitophilus oryzae TaxID=7048 RepID=A0A6J2XHN7_SITOR|nr:SET and MYND domain-containing protein 4 isoform X2 [Sitophilus oryzae]XP_030750958.1 SET and MYND domain-containing protein 4 isoform X2 [Sitophilus oryzae]